MSPPISSRWLTNDPDMCIVHFEQRSRLRIEITGSRNFPNFNKIFGDLTITNNKQRQKSWVSLTNLTNNVEKNILLTTYKNINFLLCSDKIVSNNSDSERSLLKNLGNWLGLMTLAKNKPVLNKHLNLKKLILDAFENGKLIAIIPLVHKILKNSMTSKIFKPPNPWVMGIVSLLVEIHRLNKLKLNLKFEIELLLKNLGLQSNSIETKKLLTGRVIKNISSNRDFSFGTENIIEIKEKEKN